ncbi:MAG: BatA domain-containing protein [Pirellula sp.]
MTWINMLSPLQWALLLAIPPAVLSLYFLKLKRQEALVPSTMLWKRAIEDLHVNSIWQKLRKNLLLYLQLLFLALLIWPASGPVGAA